MLVLENLTLLSLLFFFFKETRSHYVTHAVIKFRFSYLCFQKAGIIDICHKARQAQYFQR